MRVLLLCLLLAGCGPLTKPKYVVTEMRIEGVQVVYKQVGSSLVPYIDGEDYVLVVNDEFLVYTHQEVYERMEVGDFVLLHSKPDLFFTEDFNNYPVGV